MKKWSFIFSLFAALFLVACGSDSGSTPGEESVNSSSNKVLAENEFDKMYTNPKEYKGYEVTYTGNVFVAPEKDNEGIYLQVYADPENYDKNTLVAFANPDFIVNEGDYVKITGIVRDQYEGENLLGGTVTAPMIEAKSLEVVDYITAVAPTLNTLEINQELNQHGLMIKLEKIEFADTHTRVYVHATNNTSDQVNLYTYSTKLIVGNQQFENESIYDADYPELHSDILPGIESAGIITFPAIDPNTTSLKFVLDGSSDNWEIDIEPFVFTVE